MSEFKEVCVRNMVKSNSNIYYVMKVNDMYIEEYHVGTRTENIHLTKERNNAKKFYIDTTNETYYEEDVNDLLVKKHLIMELGMRDVTIHQIVEESVMYEDMFVIRPDSKGKMKLTIDMDVSENLKETEDKNE